MGAEVRVGWHDGTKRRELRARFCVNGSRGFRRERSASQREKLSIALTEPAKKCFARFTAQSARRFARAVEILRDAIDHTVGVRAKRPRHAGACEAHHDAFEMSRKRCAVFSGLLLQGRKAHRSAPLIEHVAHVGITEIDAHRPPARALLVVALEVPIDALKSDFQRDAIRRPRRDKLEGRTHDANQVAVVLPAQVRFDFVAVLYWFRSHTIFSPRSVMSGSTASNTDVSGAISGARPPVAIAVTAEPSSAFVRWINPSTMPRYP